METNMRNLLIIPMLLLAFGCTNVLTKSDMTADDEGRARDYTLAQGLNVVEFDELKCNADLGLCGPTGFRMIGGKEQDSIHIAMFNAEGDKVFEYNAEKVKAFPGQQFRSNLEAELERLGVEKVKAVADAATNIASQYFTGGL